MRLPITKAQRAQIIRRARMAEQQRCIRIVREELLGQVSRDLVGQVVKAIVLMRYAAKPSGSAGE